MQIIFDQILTVTIRDILQWKTIKNVFVHKTMKIHAQKQVHIYKEKEKHTHRYMRKNSEISSQSVRRDLVFQF